MNQPSRNMRDLIFGMLNLWVIGGAIVVSLILLMMTLALLWVTRPEPAAITQSTAVVNVILAPSSTPTSPAPTLTPSPTPTVNAPPPPPAGSISLEAYVQVVNTGGDGLRLRVDPGLNGQVRLLGAEAEVFIVKDGPRELDGFTWWYLVGPYDETRRGWGVANYLSVIQKP